MNRITVTGDAAGCRATSSTRASARSALSLGSRQRPRHDRHDASPADDDHHERRQRPGRRCRDSRRRHHRQPRRRRRHGRRRHARRASGTRRRCRPSRRTRTATSSSTSSGTRTRSTRRSRSTAAAAATPSPSTTRSDGDPNIGVLSSTSSWASSARAATSTTRTSSRCTINLGNGGNTFVVQSTHGTPSRHHDDVRSTPATATTSSTSTRSTAPTTITTRRRQRHDLRRQHDRRPRRRRLPAPSCANASLQHARQHQQRPADAQRRHRASTSCTPTTPATRRANRGVLTDSTLHGLGMTHGHPVLGHPTLLEIQPEQRQRPLHGRVDAGRTASLTVYGGDETAVDEPDRTT